MENKKNAFRFVILGAGGIAVKFCEAVELIPDCQVAAVASKSLERAQSFAQKQQIAHFYGSYEEMLDQEKPDCAYIAVLPNDHYRLTMMCLERGIPVLCEKAMFWNSEEAGSAFALAKEKGIFVMEAMWSRFLPAINQAKEWLETGRIGTAEIAQFTIGFRPEQDPKNRYFNPALGGGAARDITVYAYELTTYLLNQNIRSMSVSASWGESGVDVINHISIDFEHTLADLTTTLVTAVEERIVIYGTKGRIIVPYPHFASECMLYDERGELIVHFRDEETRNGFTYEIEECMRCIRGGRIESDRVPHKDTLACAELFDRIDATRLHADSKASGLDR